MSLTSTVASVGEGDSWSDQLARRVGVDDSALVLCIERSTHPLDRARLVHECRCALPHGGCLAVASSSISVVELVDLLIGAGFAEVRASSHRFHPLSAGKAEAGEINAVLAQAIRPADEP